MTDLEELFGGIDVYVFDQLLRGRLVPPMRVLDVGCGGGRNLVYMLREGFEVYGIDGDPQAVARCRDLAAQLAPDAPGDRFAEADPAKLPHADSSFDAVIAVAILHFAADQATWEAWVAEMFRVLKPGGLFISRLATLITMEQTLGSTAPGWYRLPDGSDRFLVNERQLIEVAGRLGAELADPIKTTYMRDMRAMTTWVLRKS